MSSITSGGGGGGPVPEDADAFGVVLDVDESVTVPEGSVWMAKVSVKDGARLAVDDEDIITDDDTNNFAHLLFTGGQELLNDSGTGSDAAYVSGWEVAE